MIILGCKRMAKPSVYTPNPDLEKILKTRLTPSRRSIINPLQGVNLEKGYMPGF
jgi:hypothetical protein